MLENEFMLLNCHRNNGILFRKGGGEFGNLSKKNFESLLGTFISVHQIIQQRDYGHTYQLSWICHPHKILFTCYYNFLVN